MRAWLSVESRAMDAWLVEASEMVALSARLLARLRRESDAARRQVDAAIADIESTRELLRRLDRSDREWS